MRVRLSQRAAKRLAEHQSYYVEHHGNATASRSLEDFRRTVRRLETFPYGGPALMGDLRLGQFLRYPYVLVYRVERDGIVVITVIHNRQSPDIGRSTDWVPAIEAICPTGHTVCMGIDFADIQALPFDQQVELELLLLKSFQNQPESEYELTAEEWKTVDRLLEGGRADPACWQQAVEFLSALEPKGYWNPEARRGGALQ